ncbi:hypothetical protein [Curtobacterium sp. MCSS17_016]|uniref:hypothetical protein n=1 Tax=Curtobacterium sp. MCSS17_016 TaxID=2175644 RepID=UPI000DAAAD5E|nr:hypothetical protein [Curtobacterium sp. MCSS17_016]WIE81215.1 hypothetical protein DEJ19_018450 [Curtobacterium sp. MCSS17_016]
MNTISPAAAAAREGARATTGQFGEQHRDPAPEGLVDTFVPGNPEYEAVQSVIRSQGHNSEDALDAALAEGQIGVDDALGMLRETYRKGRGLDAASSEEDHAVNDAIRALYESEEDFDESLALNEAGVDPLIGMMRETYTAGQRDAGAGAGAGAAAGEEPHPADLTTHIGVIHAKAAARQAVYEADQASVRLVAEDITSKFPNAAYLLMRTRGSDGFVAEEITDAVGRHVARPDADNGYLVANDRTEHEFNGELLYETLVDLPQEPPRGLDDQYLPEYNWFGRSTSYGRFRIDLRTALGK